MASARVRTFALTWLSYAGYYLTRQNLSAVKKILAPQVGEAGMAHLDTGYLAAYAGGQFVWGFLSDHVGPRRVIGVGMLCTAALSAAFGWSSGAFLLGVIWTLNGLAQATGWAPNVKAMARVPARGKRGGVMGLWSTNYIVGGLVATPLAAWCYHHGSLASVFTWPAIIVAGIGVAIFIWLPDERPARDDHAARAAARDERRAAYRLVMRRPRVWLLGSSYFFMKLIRYAFLFWLPYYGGKELGYDLDTAVWVALGFQAGGTVGAIGIGWATDRWFRGRRIPLGIACLVGLGGALCLYSWAAHQGPWANFGWLAIIGFFLYGPDSILCGASAQDVGGPAAAAATAGIINGMGSIGPIFGSEAWTAISRHYGYATGFLALGAMAVVALLVLVPLVIMQVEKKDVVHEGG